MHRTHMSKTGRLLLAGLLAMAYPTMSSADTLKLRDGTEITGTLISRHDGMVWFEHVVHQLRTTDVFDEKDIEEVIVDTKPNPAPSKSPNKEIDPPSAPDGTTQAADDEQVNSDEAVRLREWNALGRNLSLGYIRAGSVVRHVPNRGELSKLLQSQDEDVRLLARKRLGLELVRDRILTGRKCNSDFEREMWNEQFRLMIGNMPERLAEGKSFLEIFGDPNDLIQGGLNVVGRDYKTAMIGLIGEQELRDQLRSVLDRRNENRDLSSEDVRWKFKPVKPDDAVINLSNASDHPLNHVYIIAELSMDPAKTDEAADQEIQQQTTAEGIVRLLGMGDSADSVKYIIHLRWNYESIERGTTTYLVRWPVGGNVGVGLSPLVNLMKAGDSARLDIYADEGHLSIPLSVSDMQDATWKEVNKTSRKKR